MKLLQANSFYNINKNMQPIELFIFYISS